MQARGAAEEIASGERFAFGSNWRSFLDVLDEDRIAGSMTALEEYLGVGALASKTFLDIGSGSGLSSLAARRLGATVTSFDFDPGSVGCTQELRRRYFPDDPDWQVFQGSALDAEMLSRLGTFDIVYSWGVLHHTGDMWSALANVVPVVKPGGRLFVAIYNDQGRPSRVWKRVKRRYNESGPAGRWALLQGSKAYLWGKPALLRLARGRRPSPGPPPRGMDRGRDLVDWVGGWPFEVAKPEEIFDFYRARGFTLEKMFTCGAGLGCNQFVFSLPASC
jgi:2-polyprenyl-6-hydroxyphenyl methylase/3-demethylubiquinone-9 3-methyltransferase